MRFIFDASFGHAQITPKALSGAGADGVILYAGCNDATKNATKAEVQALLAAGFLVGLVIENFATDAAGGAAVGTAQGKAILAAGKALGYDVDNCVLFGGYDADSHPGDDAGLLAYMEAFAAQVPVPGYYGDSDSIDFLHARHPGWIFWQSDSRSFSPLNPTPNAHLLQLFNDGRANGLPVDVDLVERTPLRLMGENMTTLDDTDARVVWDHRPPGPLSDGTQWTLGTYVQNMHVQVTSLAGAVGDLTTAVAALKAELDAVKAQLATVAGGTVDPVALAQAIAEHVGLAAK